MATLHMLPATQRPLTVIAKATKCALTGGHDWRLITDTPQQVAELNGKIVDVEASYICRRCRTVAWEY